MSIYTLIAELKKTKIKHSWFFKELSILISVKNLYFFTYLLTQPHVLIGEHDSYY